jgi:hypothetical protein
MSAKCRLSQNPQNIALTAMPSAGSILSIGVRPLRPPCSSSVSRVLNTARYQSTPFLIMSGHQLTRSVLDKRFERVRVLLVWVGIVQISLEEE